MNLAFSAILIFVLVLPGAILQYTYARGPWWLADSVAEKVSSVQNYLDPEGEIVYSLFSAITLHLIWGYLWVFLGAQINLEALMMLLINSFGKDNQYFESSIQAITHYPGSIAFYLFSLCLFAALLGWGSHYMVRRLALDRKYQFFRFDNQWHYLLTGEALEFPGFEDLRDEAGIVGGTYLSGVVELKAKDYLYRGIVYDFLLDKTGQLDYVVLGWAHRRELSKDRSVGEIHTQDPLTTKDQRYYRIEGNFLVLKYSDMKTINIEYIGFPHTQTVPITPNQTNPVAANE